MNKGLSLVEKEVPAQLLGELIDQLNKDIRLCGLTFELERTSSPGGLVDQLRTFLMELIKSDFQGFLNLLYRIDLDESNIRNTYGAELQVYVDQCVFQVLKREWQKVSIRNKIR